MKTRLPVSIYLAPLACALILSGCNSSSSPSALPSGSNAPSTSPTLSAASTSPADTSNAPQRKPPSGMGNAIGRVLFDNKGASGIEVQLCEKLGFIGGCDGKIYNGKTDKNGYYVIDKVRPGDYAVAVRVFNTNKFIYPTSGIMSAAKFKVEKDQSLAVDTVNLWKTNLQTIAPAAGATVKIAQPKFSWKAYPDAANYKVTVRDKRGAATTEELQTATTSIASEKSLLNGEYFWQVEAFNADGTKIAETPDDVTFKIIGQAGSNTVDLAYPKQSASVAAAGLVLQWKAHPQADGYQVYLKGVKAQDPILSFQSVTGTSYKIPSPLAPDQYFWSVSAMKGDDKLAASELQHFVVK